ncbi:MAG: hypothetical protein ACXAEX_13540 [Promethearchaeota archaeon]|jgi:hypothetical protein
MQQDKFSLQTQKEIEAIKKIVQFWNNIFNYNVEHYFDGWALFLKEKNLYPRCIVVFKSYVNNHYSIRSYEIHLRNFKKEEFHEIYSKEHIEKQDELIKELKEIIYGKDLGNQVLKKYEETFSK